MGRPNICISSSLSSLSDCDLSANAIANGIDVVSDRVLGRDHDDVASISDRESANANDDEIFLRGGQRNRSAEDEGDGEDLPGSSLTIGVRAIWNDDNDEQQRSFSPSV